MNNLNTFEKIKAKKRVFALTTIYFSDTETGDFGEALVGMALPICALDFYLDGVDELVNALSSFDNALKVDSSTVVDHGKKGVFYYSDLIGTPIVLDHARPALYHRHLMPIAKKYRESTRVFKLMSNINNYISRYENKIK